MPKRKEDLVKGKYVGEKKVASSKETGEKTSGGFPIVEIQYEDGNKEWFSSLMIQEVVSENSCDASQLREKRVSKPVQLMLSVFRDWGIKIGELPYISSLLNQSLQYNSNEAIMEMWAKWMPKPQSLDEVDYMTVDKVLTEMDKKPKTIQDVIGDGSKQ